MPELTEKLLDSVNETARIARTSLLFFLVVALYLLIIVGTTTDLMLLRGEIVALPLMEVGVPLGCVLYRGTTDIFCYSMVICYCV